MGGAKKQIEIQNMTIEEKIKMLTETEKAYLNGFIDRALIEQQKNRVKKAVKKSSS